MARVLFRRRASLQTVPAAKVQIVVFLRLILTLFIEYLGEQLKSF